jgi:hypothetical protein
MTVQLENKNQYNNETNDRLFYILRIIVIKKVLSKDMVII